MIFTVLVLAATICFRFDPNDSLNHLFEDAGLFRTLGGPERVVYFLGLFMCGGCVRLFRDKIVWNAKAASLCGAVVLAGLAAGRLPAYFVIATFGAYALFWIALNVESSINATNDISYGIYLYAWPITNLIIWYFPNVDIWVLGALTFCGALLCGQASWRLVEAPATRFKVALSARPGPSI